MGAKQEQEPARPEVTEVASGVLRMQLPVTMPGLGHVNAYAVEDGRGVAIVDPGMPGPITWRALGRRLADAGIAPRHVHTVVISHSHPDHYGSARRLAEAARAEIVTHAAFRAWWSAPHRHDLTTAGEEDDGDAPPAGTPGVPWGRTTPWGGSTYRPPLRRRLAYRLFRSRAARRFAPPEPTRRVADGEVLALGGREWVALHTPGHTADHLCLFDPAEGVLLSGDHVLPTITPHISGIGTGDDPLSDFLASLERVAGLGAVRTVLPAHGHPFGDLAARVSEIVAHHEDRLGRLRRASRELGPATVSELAQQVFSRRSWGSMAESETYAHLEHLRRLGDAERWDEDGRLLYRVG